MDPLHTESPGSLWAITYGVLNDWVPYAPLMIASVVLLILFPFFSKYRKNAALLIIAVFLLPIGGLYLFCKLLNVTHFVSSRYFINFLPLFLISIYLSISAIEAKFQGLRKFMRLRFLFVILFIISNLVILPLYYRCEKQDFRDMVAYLKSQLREGDTIFVHSVVYIPAILHYFGAYPEGRQCIVPFFKDSKGLEFRGTSFIYEKKIFSILHSKTCCTQYVGDGSRLWIIIGAKWTAKEFKKNSPCVLKGYFDGSFLNLRQFPTDASLYLFPWDPKSPDEKGIDLPIE